MPLTLMDIGVETTVKAIRGKDQTRKFLQNLGFVEGAKVVLQVINHGRDKKVVIYKKRRRKDSKLKRGFRRSFTRVKVASIKA